MNSTTYLAGQAQIACKEPKQEEHCTVLIQPEQHGSTCYLAPPETPYLLIRGDKAIIQENNCLNDASVRPCHTFEREDLYISLLAPALAQ